MAAVGSAVVATALGLSGVRGTGHRLVRDFVAVPEPAAPTSVLPTTASELRAWPYDAVTWALSALVPTELQQVVILVLCLLLAGVGTGLVVAAAHVGGGDVADDRGGPTAFGRAAAAAAAAWVAVWNPYVVERLLLGHAPTLLGYSSLPWIVLVARSRLGTARRMLLLVVVAAPAALTPWGGVMALVTAVLADVSRPDRRPARAALVGALGVSWCMPWALPALLVGGVGADPDGPAAFALADDTGLGTWVSALTGGGVWATGARPPSRTDPVSLTASLALFGLAAAGVLGLAVRARRARAGGATGLPLSASGGGVAGGAATAALLLLGPATLAWWASGPGLDAMSRLQQVPGLALFRDQHRMLAPAVLAGALLVALSVGWLAGRGGRLAAGLGCGLVVALAVASVPDLPRAVRGAYRPVTYPVEWDAVVRSLEGGGGRGAVLSLPWQPVRLPPWAGEPPFLDPLPRAVRGEVLSSTSLAVRRGGRTIVVDDAPIAESWATGEVSADSLRRHGVTYVVEWLQTPGALAGPGEGWRLVHAGPDFRVWDVAGAR